MADFHEEVCSHITDFIMTDYGEATPQARQGMLNRGGNLLISHAFCKVYSMKGEGTCKREHSQYKAYAMAHVYHQYF